jgi:hypothetical protein
VKTILQEEWRLQERARDERRPGYQARVKKKEGREESDLRKIGKGDDRESRKSPVG